MEFVAGMRCSLQGFSDGGAGGGGQGEEDGVGNARVEEVGRDEVECLIANMIYKVSELSRLRPIFLFLFLLLSFLLGHKHLHRAVFQRPES